MYICMYILSIATIGEGDRKNIVNLLAHLPKLPPYLGTNTISESNFIRS
jgi:hypothetical protein